MLKRSASNSFFEEIKTRDLAHESTDKELTDQELYDIHLRYYINKVADISSYVDSYIESIETQNHTAKEYYGKLVEKLTGIETLQQLIQQLEPGKEQYPESKDLIEQHHEALTQLLRVAQPDFIQTNNEVIQEEHSSAMQPRL